MTDRPRRFAPLAPLGLAALVLLGAQAASPSLATARVLIAIGARNIAASPVRPYLILPDGSVVQLETIRVEAWNRFGSLDDILLWDPSEDARNSRTGQTFCYSASATTSFASFVATYVDAISLAPPAAQLPSIYIGTPEGLAAALAQPGSFALLEVNRAAIPDGVLAAFCPGVAADEGTPTLTVTPGGEPTQTGTPPTQTPTSPSPTRTLTPTSPVSISTPTGSPAATEPTGTAGTPTETPVCPYAPPCPHGQIHVCAAYPADCDCPCQPINADASCDGRISAADVLAMLRSIGSGGRAPCSLDDVNRDGRVDGIDLELTILALFATGPHVPLPQGALHEKSTNEVPLPQGEAR